jgi:outer membrane protein assembly factor BamB
MRRLVAIGFLLLWIGSSSAGDWPQWLGPNRDNSTSEIVEAWKVRPKVIWKQNIGEGNSSPVVAEGRVFLLARGPGENEENLTAFDARIGKMLWKSHYARAAFKSLYGNGPRATPAVSCGRIFTFGITGVLTCFETANGKQSWQVDTWKDFHPTPLVFGASCSPLVAGENVLVNVGAKGASVVAFDKNTGKTDWLSQDDSASYSSPISFGADKERQVVFLTGKGLLSLSPADGQLFWKFPLVDFLLESSTTPVKVGGVLVASSITYGSVGLKLQSKDGKPEVKQLWKNDQLTCYFSTPVAVGLDYLYMVTGANPLKFKTGATLRCVEVKTGKELWQKPNVGQYHAALIRTGNDKLLMLEDNGSLVLLDPNPKEYRELARAKICGPTWAHPALSNGRLYVRDEKELICLELMASK